RAAAPSISSSFSQVNYESARCLISAVSALNIYSAVYISMSIARPQYIRVEIVHIICEVRHIYEMRHVSPAADYH
ncbi:hypothetical protein GBAR_LOCUS4573, partial [Geodia barretti]